MKLKNLIIALLLMFPLWCFAENPPTFMVPLKKGQLPPPVDRDPNKSGGRMPAKETICFISAEEGVQIEAIADSQILSYEIYFEEESCVGFFSNAEDFVNTLMQLPEGEYVIQFQTEKYIYRGDITIE